MSPDPTAPARTFARGARPSPRHALLAAAPHVVAAPPPPQYAVVPPKLDVWGNSTYGDCVSAEEAFAKACWSLACGLPELFATEAEVVAFARRYGFLNGATLTEVMDAMARYGMSIGGKTYQDGGYAGVDFSNETVLQSALTVGPVKIGIDASALPSGAGNQQGWYATRGGNYRNTDHCVGLCGYGPAGWLYQQLGVPLPAGLSADAPGYLLFTWSTIGFVTHDWLMGTCTEAWVRNPTTVGQTPAPTPPPVPPAPPAPATVTVSLPALDVYVGRLAVGHTKPFVGTFPVAAPKAAAAEAGLNFDLVLALVRLSRDLAGYGPGVRAAFDGFLAAVRTRTGILEALSAVAQEVVVIGGDPAILADLNRIAADLGLAA